GRANERGVVQRLRRGPHAAVAPRLLFDRPECRARVRRRRRLHGEAGAIRDDALQRDAAGRARAFDAGDERVDERLEAIVTEDQILREGLEAEDLEETARQTLGLPG